MALYNAYVVNIAVPAVGRRLSAGVAAIDWTLTSYLLGVAGLLLVASAVADRLGWRLVVVAGLAVMFLGSVLYRVAPFIDAPVGAGTVQGLGAALVTPTSLALLNGTLRTSNRARGIGIWGGLSTLATTVRPTSAAGSSITARGAGCFCSTCR